MIGTFRETTWLGYALGAFLGVILLMALVMSIWFPPVDIYRRHDIGLAKKLLWIVAFVASAGSLLILYGVTRYSSTNGTAGA